MRYAVRASRDLNDGAREASFPQCVLSAQNGKFQFRRFTEISTTIRGRDKKTSTEPRAKRA
jgi:hypothetical protein